MRKITLLAGLLIGFALNAQIYYQLPVGQGNPGGLNTDDEYPVGSGLDASWTTILGASQATPAWSANQTIPFTFEFNSTTETSYKVSSTGILTFSSGNSTAPPSSTNATLPNASIPDKSICVWGIEGTGGSDNIVTKVFGTAPNRQLWVFFSSYTIPGAPTSWSYWSIVLEETTNNIYIVDQRNANGTIAATLGVQVNSTSAYQVSGSPNVGHLSGNGATAADNFYYSFLPGPQPTYDAQATRINNPDFLGASAAPYTLEGEFLNLGSATITSADINYTINGGSTVTSAVSGLNITSGSSADISHPTTWNPTSGTYTVEMWLSNINGNADEKPANDKTSKQLTIVPVVRYPLYETFTSSTCPPCVPANINMEAIFANNPGEHVSLKYQMSWPGSGDPYYTDEGGVRRQYYGISAVPYVQIDGGWNSNGNSLTQAIYDQYQQVTSYVILDATYSISGQTVDVDVTINPTQNFPSNNLRVFVAIKEKLTFDNVKTNGETEFYDVMKKMVPDAQGDPISPLQSGTTVTKGYSYTFNGSKILPPNAGSPVNHAIAHTVEEFSDLAVVVWVQDVNTKEILNSVEAAIVLGVDDFDGETHNLKLFPNPANDVAYVSIDMTRSAEAELQVVNALGQVVLAKNANLESGTNMVDLNTSSLASGVYFVQIDIEGSTQTLKLTVQ